MTQVDKTLIGEALLWAAGGIIGVLVLRDRLDIEPVALWALLVALAAASIPFWRK